MSPEYAPRNRGNRIRGSASRRHGERVMKEILDASPNGGIKTDALVAITGLSKSQVYSGLRWIQEFGATQIGKPYTRTRKYGHGFPDDPDDWRQYERLVSAGQKNINLRLMTSTFVPHLQCLPKDRVARLALKQLDVIVESSEFISTQAPNE